MGSWASSLEVEEKVHCQLSSGSKDVPVLCEANRKGRWSSFLSVHLTTDIAAAKNVNSCAVMSNNLIVVLPVAITCIVISTVPYLLYGIIIKHLLLGAVLLFKPQWSWILRVLLVSESWSEDWATTILSNSLPLDRRRDPWLSPLREPVCSK